MAAFVVLLLSACRHAPANIAATPDLRAAVASLPVRNDAVVLVGTGDVASCDAQEGAAATGTLIRAVLERAPGARVFTTGDHAYPDGSPEEFERCFDPHWGAFNDRTWPTPGNHDYRSEDAAGYFGYFEVFDAMPEARPRGYYRAQHGSWSIVVLNSLLALDAASVQLRWLERELQRKPAECLLALWHHPLRSSGFHGRMPWDEGRDTRVFWEVLYRHGADIVLNGHDHLYERFARVDPNGDPDPGGIRQLTVGTGGAHLHRALGSEPQSEFAVDSTYGVLVLWLGESSYEWAYVGADGRVHDASEAPTACR